MNGLAQILQVRLPDGEGSLRAYVPSNPEMATEEALGDMYQHMHIEHCAGTPVRISNPPDADKTVLNCDNCGFRLRISKSIKTLNALATILGQERD